jgi:hypothetical protein
MDNLAVSLKKLSLEGSYTKAQLQETVMDVSLDSPNTLAQFESLLKESIKNNDSKLALMCRYLLEDILVAPKQKTLVRDPETYRRFQTQIALFKFINLSIRGLPEINNLVSENLIEASRAGIKIKEKFQEVLDSFDDFLMEGHIAEALANSMIACEEKIGNLAISKNESKAVPQTVGNWLNDYLQYGLGSAEHKTGSIERIGYFRFNKNTQALSEEDKQVLLEIFRLYDWLRYGEHSGEKESTISVGETAYMQSGRYELPEEILKPLPVSLPFKTPPIVPVPKGRGERREMGDVDRNVGSQKADKSDNTALGTLTPTLSQREREENSNNESNFAKATSDLKKTVSGEAADLGTDNNQFRGQGGGGLPQAAVAPVRKILNQEDAYVPRGNRVNIQDILKNKEQAARNKSHGEGFGLKMGDGGGGNNKKTVNPLSLIHNPPRLAPSETGSLLNKQAEKQSGVSKQEEIDKKLEELEKRVEKN